MTTKEFDALVNKGLITQVGTIGDTVMPTPDFCKMHVTHVNVADELVEADVDTPAEVLNVFGDGGEVELAGDVVLDPAQTITVSKDSAIDLKGNALKGQVSPSWKDNGDLLHIAGGNVRIANGTIKDELAWDGKSSPAGTVFVDGGAQVELENVNVEGVYPVWVKDNGAVVTIKSGSFKSTVSQTLYVQGQSKIIVEGGTFEAPMFGTKNYCLNVKDSDYVKTKPATDYIEVRGGRFINFNPAMNSENPMSSFVAEGYESVEVGPGVFEVRKAEIAPVAEPVAETVVEEAPAAPAKKSKKAKNVAPSVDPVE